MRGTQREHLPPIVHRARVGIELHTQDALLVVVVPGLDVGELAGLRQRLPRAQVGAILDGPAGEGARRLVDILVDIPFGLAPRRARHVAPACVEVVQVRIAPERMQFEEFARVVLVCAAGTRRTIVQVIQHARVGSACAQHVAEITERMRADDLALPVWQESADVLLIAV